MAFGIGAELIDSSEYLLEGTGHVAGVTQPAASMQRCIACGLACGAQGLAMHEFKP